MKFQYLIAPFLAWLLTGSTKFLVNSFKARSLAFNQIGYGGFPSNHTAIVTSVLFLIFFNEGLDSPSFGSALALTFIVVLDANSLRRTIGQHAERINSLVSVDLITPLRERIGHTKFEIFGGAITGFISAYCLYFFFYEGIL
jgi:acid phosphatase family membrane protein YuiD